MNKNRFFVAWIVSLGSLIFFISALYVSNTIFGIDYFSKTFSLPIYSIIPGVLVILSIWAITKPNTIANLPKKTTVFLALSFSCWFIAEQIWNFYEHVLGIDPYPSIADIFYFSAPIFMFFSLIFFLRTKNEKISKKKIFFAAIVSAIILFPSIFFLLQEQTETSMLETVIAFAYPIADSILLVPVILAFFYVNPNKHDFFWIMILVGICIFLIADNLFLFLIVNDLYVDGHPVDILWASSYTIWVFMMFYSIKESQYNEKSTSMKVGKNGKLVEKHGILITLILINATIVGLLVAINYYSHYPEEIVLIYFSFILIMTVIIFSSIVVLLNSQMNKKLWVRTKQLEETSYELVKSERFRAIGELASRISHDIRNPLSNIRMSIDLINKNPSETKLNNPSIQDKMELISRNLDRISHQINDVLGFVKNNPINKKICTVSSLLDESLELIKIPPNIKIEVANLDVKISADPFQMQIVFNNILINALQAIGKKKGKISMKVFETEYEAVLNFSNTGPAIPDEILPYIFESLVTTKQIGTGLGLVSCKTIVENHGGKITVKNNPTTFSIKIPKSN